ncbi:TetR/AcrR family transcriptional regulator [Kribbella sp. GL6]|uniref:TetR/AcrR family transcriptional regulator n=1 Tax=Kribbella sp. GL6 TaxID=3419765 RepID=UPI003D03E912
MTVRRTPGRPRTTVLDRERIVTAALALIDEVGDSFSVNALAARLVVRPSSLYNHFANKDEILFGVQEVITDAIDASMFERLPWADAVAAWAHSYRAAFVRHPHAIPLFAVSPVAGQVRTVAMYERVVQGFERAGWPSERILPAIVALESFILGSALDAIAAPDLLAPGDAGKQVPHLAAAVAAHEHAVADSGLRAADLAFTVGLSAMIRGLADHSPHASD